MNTSVNTVKVEEKTYLHENKKPEDNVEQSILRRWDNLKKDNFDDISFCSTFDDLASFGSSSVIDTDSEDIFGLRDEDQNVNCSNDFKQDELSPPDVLVINSGFKEETLDHFKPTPLNDEVNLQKDAGQIKKHFIDELDIISSDDNELRYLQENPPSKRRCSMPSCFSYNSSALENSQEKKHAEANLKKENVDCSINDMPKSPSSEKENQDRQVETKHQTNLHGQEEFVDLTSEAAFRKLQRTMLRSSVTQRALQKWDKKMGLPKNHCPTMVMSSKSRSQLQEEILMIAEFGQDYYDDDCEGSMQRRMTCPY